MNTELSSLMSFINSTKTVVDPTLNQEYTVVCINDFPVVPFIHQDVEITGGFLGMGKVDDTDWHVHLDFRFFDNAMIRRWKGDRPHRAYQRRHGHVFFLHDVARHGYPVVLKQLPCRRPSLGVPVDQIWESVQKQLSTTMPELHNAEANFKKLQCQRCPHKGYPFDSTNVKGGLLHCPMHGQKFLLKNGRWIKPPTRNPTELTLNHH